MNYARLSPLHLGPRPWHGIAYYLQRLVRDPVLRRRIGRSLGNFLHPDFATAPLPPAAAQAAESLTRQGHAPAPALLTPEQVADIHAFLAARLCYRGRSPERMFPLKERPADTAVAEYPTADILDAPHLLDLVNHPAVLGAVTRYLGCRPTLSSLVLRWSFPQGGDRRDIEDLQRYHRDIDDWTFVKMFVYLTDVAEDCGPHVYISGSHRQRGSWRSRFYSDEEARRIGGDLPEVRLLGPAGSAFLVDTFGLHKGAVPTQRPRLMLQAEYSALPVFLYDYRPQRPQRPLPAGLDRDINRLFIA